MSRDDRPDWDRQFEETEEERQERWAARWRKARREGAAVSDHHHGSDLDRIVAQAGTRTERECALERALRRLRHVCGRNLERLVAGDPMLAAQIDEAIALADRALNLEMGR